MKLILSPPRIIVVFATFFSLLQCRQEIPLDNNDQDFPIQLTSTVTDNVVQMTWSRNTTTTFGGYTLVRSEQPISPNQPPSSSTTIMHTNSLDSTRFSEILPTFSEKVYYKVYLKIGDRFIESNTVSIDLSSFVSDGFIFFTKVHPDSTWIILGIQKLGNIPQISVLDYKNKKIIGEIALPDISDPNGIGLDFTSTLSKAELLVTTTSGRLLRLSLPDLSIIEETPLAISTWSILRSPASNWLFLTAYDYNNGFHIRDITSPSLILNSQYRSDDYYYDRDLAFLDPNNLSILEYSYNTLRRFRLSPINGNPISAYSKTINYGGSGFIFQFDLPMTPDRSYFVPNQAGFIFDRDLTLVNTIPGLQLSLNGRDIRFSKDGQFVYSLEASTTSFGAVINKYSFPALALVGNVNINNINPIRIQCLDSDEVFVIASNGITPSKYTLINIKL